MATLIFPVVRRDHFMYPAAMFRTPERPTHGGIDFTPITLNKSEPMYAIERGKIIIADSTANIGDTSGKDIMILGAETGIRWWYGHASVVSVTLGQQVKAGEYIGMTGTTGSSATGKASSTGVHLHLEAHYPSINVEIDPWKYLKDAPDIHGSTVPLATTRDGGKALADNYPTKTSAEQTPTGGSQTGGSSFMTFTPEQEARMYAQIEAIRTSQIVPGTGYTYDAALLSLVQGLYPALSKVTDAIIAANAASGAEPDVDVQALANLITDQLGKEVARTLGEAIVRGAQ